MNANTDIKAVVPQQATQADARSRAYSLFAQAFRYPEREVFEALTDGSYLDDLREAVCISFPQLGDAFEERYAPHLKLEGDIADFEASYLAAFENNLPQPSISLYEGSYDEHRNEKPRLLLELKSLYRNFGLTMAANDMEDALTAQLEFMQFLTAKQALAEEGALDRTPYVLAQRDFLEHYLAAWLPLLQAEAESKLKNPFYKALIALVNHFATLDAKTMETYVAGQDA